MSLPGLLEAVLADPGLAQVAARAGGRRGLELSAPGGARPFVAAALARDGGSVLVVTATEREARELTDALASLLGDPALVAEFPAWETLPHERLSPRADTVGRRLDVLRRLKHPGEDGRGAPRVVVAPARSLLQPLVKNLGDLEPVRLDAGKEVGGGLTALVENLVRLAYLRVDLVERRGEFAVRGGIVDVFPPTEDHPVRVELWGDEVDSLRPFSVADQRSFEGATREHLTAPPCREVLLTDGVRARAKALLAQHPELSSMLERLADGIPVEGMEALSPVLADGLELLVDVLPKDAAVLACDPERLRTRSHELVETSREFLEAAWSTVAEGGTSTPLDVGAAAYQPLADVREHAADSGRAWWELTPFGTGEGWEADLDADAVVLGLRPVTAYRGDAGAALADVRAAVADGWAVVVVAEGKGSADRLAESFRGADLGVRRVDALAEVPAPGLVTVVRGTLVTGVSVPSAKVVVLTETDLAGNRGVTSTRDMRKMPSKRRGVDPLMLKVGDFVVHDKHGVGKYVGMERRTVNGGEREYIVLEYAAGKRGQPGDQLRVPTDQLDQLSRYSGGEAPTLHKLGGSDWAQSKARARKAVREIAGELIRLYSARVAAPGYAFGPDTPWQRELEDAFAYNETGDQLAAIDDVKRDMEKPVPMDRVICGDVGYGKTEIAVRAAFKAVMDGKQVAVLVPTTLLVQQHLQTFSERFAQFPVTVRALSRFQTTKESTAVLKGLAAGEIDVVIGTHRLFSADTTFKDLGLVIVDEEQRFGVEHKEHLKKMRVDVDVLTMSATPIPRTLEMSITGIRELSTIDTPPEERHPILTYVGAYEERTVAAAIRRELLREGQVFFVHNRVESIERTAAKIRELVPEARVETAHGQMTEEALERVMVGFWEREYDVLVCTTIVESGLDVSNANTLIVDRGDVLGLSQLHQLRGRVGRGRERGYAYFLFPPGKPLSETAHDRLVTIAQNTDLGAGMAVAMKDLEIRGAGNLLGGEQSGTIASVGFDLYTRMVGEAVQTYKGETPDDVAEIRIDLPVDANLPHDYVPAERLRLIAYRALSEAPDDAAVAAVEAELVDRYGPLPEQAVALLAVARLRVLLRGYGVTEVSVMGPSVRIGPMDLAESKQLRLARLYKGAQFKAPVRMAVVPKPLVYGAAQNMGMRGEQLRGVELLAWVADLVTGVMGEPPVRAAAS